MGSGYDQPNKDKGLFSHLLDAGHYQHHPPQCHGYGYPYPPYGGYPPHVFPPSGGYPPVAYPASSTAYFPGHGHGMGTFLAGGAAALAATYGARHGYGPHGYGCYGHHRHHGKFKHYKFKRAKFGKHWKHGQMFGKHKMWK